MRFSKNVDLLVPLIVVIQLVQELFVQLNAFPDVSVRKDTFEDAIKNVSNQKNAQLWIVMVNSKSTATVELVNEIAKTQLVQVLFAQRNASKAASVRKDTLEMQLEIVLNPKIVQVVRKVV
jgi:hypothetical protein